MKTIASTEKCTKFGEDAQIILDELETFKKRIYSKIVTEEELSYEGLTQMIYDQATGMVTAFKNHIQEHFADIVRGYINIISNKNELIEKYDKNVVLNQLQKVKNDILKGTNTVNEQFSVYVTYFKNKILDVSPFDQTLESMAADHGDMRLLPLMIRMSIDAENISRSRLGPDEKDKNIRVLNCFPIRNSSIPSYVDIDGFLIIRLLLTENIRHYEKNITKLSDELWAKFFWTDRSIFRKNGYTFNHRISTDGIGCSIHFLRNDLYNMEKKDRPRYQKKPKNFSMDKYINHITDEERKEILKRRTQGMNSFVGIDPGKRDLIFCTNGDTKILKKENSDKMYRKTTTFSYSNGRRKEETKEPIFSRRMDKEKKTRSFNGNTIKSIEGTLSTLNSDSCIWSNVINFMNQKSFVDKILREYYEEDRHRIYRWYKKLNKERSEANMLNRFQKTFGSPDDVIIFMGDWSENKPMRHQEPTLGKSIRRLFRNRGYKLYLVDEYNTSKKLYETGEELVKFRKDKEDKTVHRVLTTALIKELSEQKFIHTSHPPSFIKDLIETTPYRATIINRDLNGSLNIRWKGICQLYDFALPDYLSRSGLKKESTKETAKEEDQILDIKLEILDKKIKETCNSVVPKVLKTLKATKAQKIQK